MTTAHKLRSLRLIHEFFLPLVSNKKSNAFIANFQQFCGVHGDGSINNKYLHFYFKLASTTGEEIFGLLPLMFWYVLPLGIPIGTNFGVILAGGQICKDLLLLPRPPADWGGPRPIVKLERHFETEYGLPSTHTMSGLLPMCAAFALSRLGLQPSPFWWWMSGVYVVSVGFSRLYMGVHSPMDICFGGFLGAILMMFCHYFGDQLDSFLYKSPGGIFGTILILFLFITVYPKARPWSASYGTAAQIVGSWLGVAASIWTVSVPYPWIGEVLEATSVLNPNSAHSLMLNFKRLAIAVPVCLLAKVLTKEVAVVVFMFLHTSKSIPAHPDDLFDANKRPVPPNKTYWVEVPVRLINYGSLAAATIILVPILWLKAGLV